MSSLDLFMARHRQIEDRLVDFRADFGDLGEFGFHTIDLCGPTGLLLRRALDLPDQDFSSWLPGIPLPALLAAGRRVIVDIAPAFLSAFRSNYGLSEEALIEFARAGMLILNIRDFDPGQTDADPVRQARDYDRWDRFLGAIFDAAPHSTYFLASLRPRVFDAIPDFAAPRSAPKPGLAEIFSIAQRDLAGAAAAARSLSKTDSQVIRALFRTEEAAPVATFWHWAYVRSVDRFIDPEFKAYIQKEYDILAGAPASGHVGEDEQKSYDLGTRFVEFQMRMRYAHLRYSAPLSGAFGGAYGYSLDDEHVFLQAVDRHYRWAPETPFDYDYFADDLLDLIQDLQMGQLRPRFREKLTGRQWEMLRPLGVEAYCRTEPTSYYEHYSDPTNRAELIAFWHDARWRKLRYSDLQRQMDALLGKEGGVEPRDLFELAAMKDDARAAANAALRQHSEGYQTISSPSQGSRGMPGEVRVTDPKEPNLLLRILMYFGLATGNGETAVGHRGDYGRTAYSAGGAFRNRPS